jgi:class 3 adenylate cyclase/tetratricopeptide (TPR) repeat protein
MLVCPNCGRENADDARFCSSCGRPLEAGEAPREERKVVSVLFADLVGFTSRAEEMDPEDVRALLSPYYSRLRSELQGFGGTVEKFIGDAVMAIFGAPQAHEDDPERAVRAALAIQDWIGEQQDDLQVRIAVNTGEALVTLGARPSEGEGMAAGDVVNTAARMQAAAPVNGVLVGESTYRATRDVIDYAEAIPVEAKGKSGPIQVWQPLRARAPVGVDTVQTGAPLIGREREIDLLSAALGRAREEPSTQLVTLVGVPGIGKSRLVYELWRLVEADPDPIAWCQGRSLPYGNGVTFWALGEMIKAQAGVLESDTSEQVEEKLRRSARDVVAEDAEWTEGHLRPLLGLATDDGEAGGEAFVAWRRYIEGLADRSPLILVFEDLHWADDGLLDFIDHLVDWASGVPLLVVGTARPELLERRPGWGGGKANAVTLSLSALSSKQTAVLIGALLGKAVLDADAQQLLLQQAGGNPLYAEQYVRMLAERGPQDESALPESVQGIIAARLDGLPSGEKELLQAAAVVGKVFWLGAVSDIGGVERRATEEQLHALERKEFIKRARSSSVARDTEYAFGHVLVRDVAYGQIPRALRADKHRRAGEWIESLGRPEDHAELIAEHYVNALEYSKAAGREDSSLQARARVALRDAGDRTMALGAFAASARFYESALGLGPEGTERAELLHGSGRALFWGEESGLDRIIEAAREFRAAGDVDGAAESLSLAANFLWYRRDRDQAYAYIDEALALVADRPPSRGKAEALVRRCAFHMVAGEYGETLRAGPEALAMVEKLGLRSLHARTLNVVGPARVFTGDLSGIDDLRQARSIAHEAKAFEYLHSSYENLRAAFFYLGRLHEASELLPLQIESVERYGKAHDRRWVRLEHGLEQLVHGRWDDALRIADDFLAEVEAGSPHYLEPAGRTLRAMIRLGRADVAGASSEAERAVAAAGAAGDNQALVPALSALGLVALAGNRREQANRLVSEVLSLGRGVIPAAFTGTIPSVPSFADFAWLTSDLGRASDLLSELEAAPMETPWIEAARAIAAGEPARAAEILGDMGHPAGEAYARLRAAERLVREGRRAESDTQLASALAYYREAGATAYVRRGEELLAASA